MHAFIFRGLVGLTAIVGILLAVLAIIAAIVVIVAEAAISLRTFKVCPIVLVKISLALVTSLGSQWLIGAVLSLKVLASIHLPLLGSALLRINGGGRTSRGGVLCFYPCVIIVWITVLKLMILSLMIFGHL